MYGKSAVFSVILSLCSLYVSAQQITDGRYQPQIRISGFMDVFYVYDFNRPETAYRQPFLFNHNRHNEFNLNLGLLTVAVENARYRANLALQTGTYAHDNYAAEPGILKNIFEANVGIALNKRHSLWLDAGILPSHIGFESAVSADNPTLTRSLAAENSPYFLTGLRLTFNAGNTWYFAVIVCNGWQRIQRLRGNSLRSLGTRLTYRPTARTMLNWSTFLGTDDPDTQRRMRYFNNFYGRFGLTDRISLMAGFDVGIQQHRKKSRRYDTWFAPVIIGQYEVNEKWKAAVRAEYYGDRAGVIIPVEGINGFRTSGWSCNIDYTPVPGMVCRLEGRWLNSPYSLCNDGDIMVNNNFFIGTSIAFGFSERIGPDHRKK